MLHRENYRQMFLPEVMDQLEALPYEITRDHLYTPEEILAGYDPEKPETLAQSFDARVFRHFIESERSGASGLEKWAQGCHDAAINRALKHMLRNYNPRRVVGIMGGHMLPRSHTAFRQIVSLAKGLTEEGFLVSSGGGPGAMEAVHLGAWLADRPQEDVQTVLDILAAADFYDEPKWLPSACEVIRRFPRRSNRDSLAIPTWLFGREPPTIFCSKIAKFFSNSIREDMLLSTAFGGILLLPGSAGTFREIFQKIAQNHYLTLEYPSPMIFVGRDYWTKSVPLYPVIQDMLRSRNLKNLLTYLVDDISDVMELVSDFENIYSLIQKKKKTVALDAF